MLKNSHIICLLVSCIGFCAVANSTPIEEIIVKGQKDSRLSDSINTKGHGTDFKDRTKEKRRESRKDRKEEREERKCEKKIDKTIAQCKSAYTFYTGAAGTLCVKMSGDWLKTFCGSTATFLITEARDWCDAQGKRAKRKQC